MLCGFRRRRNDRSLQLIAALLASTGVALVAVGASANPDIRGKREQARVILAQVQQLDAEVGDAAERWNAANYELTRVVGELNSTKRYLGIAHAQLKLSQGRAEARLRTLYMHREQPSAIEVILGAKNLDDVLSRIDAAKRVAAQDTRLIRRLKSYRASVTAREHQLTRARAAQTEIVYTRAAEKQAIEAKLAERERLLSSIQDEVRRLEAEERRRQAQLRRQALERLQRQQALAAAQARAAVEAQAGPGPETQLFANELIPPAPPSDASKGAQVVQIAIQYLGVPYVWGASGPGAFDCSGLTAFVYAQIGISLPHHAATQYGYGTPVPRDQLEAGDLVFFHGLGHMGMYIGGGNFIHAPHTGDVVKISSLSDPWYASTWVGAKRIL